MLESRIVDLFKEKVFLRKIFIPSEMSYFKSIGKINFLGESWEKSSWWRTQKHQSAHWWSVNGSCGSMELDFTAVQAVVFIRSGRGKCFWAQNCRWIIVTRNFRTKSIIFGTIFRTRNGIATFPPIEQDLAKKSLDDDISLWIHDKTRENQIKLINGSKIDLIKWETFINHSKMIQWSMLQ